jgi:hypothetical protein
MHMYKVFFMLLRSHTNLRKRQFLFSQEKLVTFNPISNNHQATVAINFFLI